MHAHKAPGHQRLQPPVLLHIDVYKRQVDVHTKWMGMETVLTLLEQIESGRNYRKKIEFSPALLERASVGGETEKE